MNWTLKLLNYYKNTARDLPWRHTHDPYRIWISEIMLQQTRVETVIGYYNRFLTKFPDVSSLATCDDTELFKLWEGLGYYSRAKNLKKCASIIKNDYNCTFPSDLKSLLSLPGIGPYTAGAIASIAFGTPVPAIDGNFYRVYSRLFADKRNVSDEKTKKQIAEAAKQIIPKDFPGEFNQAVMDLGATVCLPVGKPLCERCPLKSDCKAHMLSEETAFPVKAEKKKRTLITKTVFALHTDAGYLGYIRSSTGLLAGLYQLPDADSGMNMPNFLAYLGNFSIRPISDISVFVRKHIFTHIEWHMTVYAAEVTCDSLPDGWIILKDHIHPLPTAYKKCIPDKHK